MYEIDLYIMDDFGSSEIARKLKERKILTPAAYYESKKTIHSPEIEWEGHF